MNAELKPLACPFCGHVGLDFAEGSTFRWIVGSCGGCAATRGETRIQTLGQGTKEEWVAVAQADAIAEWNRRATPAPGAPGQEAAAVQAVAQETDRDWSKAQDWKGMDGATAFLLINRHSDGWGDVGAMMNAWLAANADGEKPS